MLTEVSRVAICALQRVADELLYRLARWAEGEVSPLSMDQMGPDRFVSTDPSGRNTGHLNADLAEGWVEPNDETQDAS